MKKNLLVFASSFPSSHGATEGVFVAELAERLTADFNVFVLSPKLTPDSAAEEEFSGVRIRRFSDGIVAGHGGMLVRVRKHRWMKLALPWFLLVEFFALLRQIKRDKIEVIHAHWVLPQGLLAVLAKRFFFRRLRVVATAHGSDLLELRGRLSRRLASYTLRHLDGFSAVGPKLAEAAGSLGYDRPIPIYPMGIDTEVFSPEKRSGAAHRQPGDTGPRVLFVGQMIQRKGGDLLLRAWPEVNRVHPDAELLLIGDGPLKLEWQTLAQKLGVAGKVHFIAPVPHAGLAAYFADCDVFVLPAREEGFGLVTLEALACGTAAAVTDIRVYAAMERDFGGGLLTLFAPEDPDSLARAILDTLKNPPVPETRRRRREYVVEHFGMERCRRNYCGLLNGEDSPR